MKHLGQTCEYELEYEENTIRIWDTGSEITISGDCVTEEDMKQLHKNLKFVTIESTGDDGSELVAAWSKIEKEVREYFNGFDVEIES